MSKCVASEEDTLPDINTEKFTGAQRKEEYIGVQRNEFTGAPITGTPITGASITGAPITGTLNENKEELIMGAQIFRIEDDWIVTGAPSVTGIHESAEDDNVTGPHVTGTPVTGTLHEDIMVTGTHVTGALEENIPVTGAPFTGAQWSDLRKTP